MAKPKQPEDDELFNFETALVVAWPGPGDPPPRRVRLPGLRVECWPQRDGSVLYEIKYRNSPFRARKARRAYHDTLQIDGTQAKSLRDSALKKIEEARGRLKTNEDRRHESREELSTKGSGAVPALTPEDSSVQSSASSDAIPQGTVEDPAVQEGPPFQASDTARFSNDGVYPTKDSDTYALDGSLSDDSDALPLRRPGSQGK